MAPHRLATYTVNGAQKYGAVTDTGMVDLSARFGKDYPTLREVIAAGAPGDALYFVASGKLSGTEAASADGERSYVPGDVIGAKQLFDHDVHTNSMITRSRCRLLKLHREDFHRLEVTHPRVSARIRRATMVGPTGSDS